MVNMVKFLLRLYFKIFYKVEEVGIDKIPHNEGIIIAPNHIHFADPLLIGSFYPDKMKAMAKDQLFKNKLLGKFLTYLGAFPVNRDGNDMKAIRTSLKILKSNQHLLVFPEGTRNKLHGKLHSEGKPGVALLAIKTKTRVLPVTIDSNYKLFGKIKIIYHDPISLDKYYNTKLSTNDYEKIINDLLDYLYESVELRI